MQHFKQLIATELCKILDSITPHHTVTPQQIEGLLTYPTDIKLGDVALPCFHLSKALRESPIVIADKLQAQFSHEAFEAVTAVNGYLNFYIDYTKFAKSIMPQITSQDTQYGAQNIGAGKTIIIDYSSPNIAKSFHVAHLRSTVIGNSLYQIYKFLGFNVVGINHLGDWGTQFGKLIVAYKLWGNEEVVKEQGIEELLRLYVLFHQESEHQPELEDQARAWFTKMEQGNEEAIAIWQWFLDISMQEFNRIYDLLGVTFDSFCGESFYNDKMEATIQTLKKKQLLTQDDGAWIVPFENDEIPPAIMLKKDGSSLYHTRDVTAAIYRYDTYHFDQAIYVTDYSQNLHFKQWFKIIEMMDYPWAKGLIHVPFGRISLEGSGFSTRKGNMIKLEEVLGQAIQKTKSIIQEKNPQLPHADEVAKQVGVGAVIFNDLSNNRIKDIVFSWDHILNFKGETGPYVQYVHARCCRLLTEAKLDKATLLTLLTALYEQLPRDFLTPESKQLLKLLSLFSEKIVAAMKKLEPSIISRYLIDLSQAFNRFYHENKVLVEDNSLRHFRLGLVLCTQITLRNGLALIGLQAPQQI